MLDDEVIDESQSLLLYDHSAPWKKMLLLPGAYRARELMVPVFVNGECVYQSPEVMEIREYCKKELASLWEEHKRLQNPHTVPVDLSDKLYQLKAKMIRDYSGI